MHEKVSCVTSAGLLWLRALTHSFFHFIRSSSNEVTCKIKVEQDSKAQRCTCSCPQIVLTY